MIKKLTCLVLCLIIISGLIGCTTGNDLEPEQDLESLKEEYKRRRYDDIEQNEDPALEIQSDHKHRTKGDYVYVTGSVKNTGNSTISYFQIICKFKDEDGQVFDAAYTNDNLELEPDEMRKFEIMHKRVDDWKKYSLSIGEVK